MEDIVLIHRKSNKKIESKFSTFASCLRQLVFVPEIDFQSSDHALPLEPTDEVLTGQKATQTMIEILCGLHSPLIGETEIFGQFKNFYEKTLQLPENSFTRALCGKKWINFIFQQVKQLRHQYLVNLGSVSYGSLSRRLLKDYPQISIFGSGHLAHEIAPWLADQANVSVYCRNLEETKDKWSDLARSSLQLIPYSDYRTLDEALIIAAPLSNACLKKEFEKRQRVPEFVIDLRGNGQALEPWDFDNKVYLDLHHFFEKFKEVQNKNSELKDFLNKLINKISTDYYHRADYRPLGWYDLCVW